MCRRGGLPSNNMHTAVTVDPSMCRNLPFCFYCRSDLNLTKPRISVLSQDNVVGREYTYVNATVRNRRAFVRAVYEVWY